MTNTGDAEVICGLSGKNLFPYYIPRSGHLACGVRAYFSVPEAVIRISFPHHRGDGDVDIRKFSTRLVPYGIVLDEFKIWSGRPENLPLRFKQYSRAVSVAIEKAQCYHCREPHYIAVKE